MAVTQRRINPRDHPYYVDNDPVSFKVAFRGRKKSKKRVTPEEDFMRLAERVWRYGRGKIRNKADFLGVYNGYMRGSPERNNVELREATFEELQRKHKVSSSVGTTRKRMRVFSAAGKHVPVVEFEYWGSIKNKGADSSHQVKVRRTKLPSGRVVYRDRRGRFAKLI